MKKDTECWLQYADENLKSARGRQSIGKGGGRISIPFSCMVIEVLIEKMPTLAASSMT